MSEPADLPTSDLTSVPTRVYGAVFGRVWLASLAALRRMPKWTVVRSDPAHGNISIESKAGWIRAARSGVITIALDDLGLTRVAAGFVGRAGAVDPSVNRRQIDRFFRLLERALSADAGR